jgi:hypothetical protein
MNSWGTRDALKSDREVDKGVGILSRISALPTHSIFEIQQAVKSLVSVIS